MAELFVSRRAEQELRRIWRDISTESPAAADRLLLKIDKRLQVLRDFPNMGAPRADIRPGFRMLVEGDYLLLYEYDEANDAVELIAVVNARQDLAELF